MIQRVYNAFRWTIYDLTVSLIETNLIRFLLNIIWNALLVNLFKLITEFNNLLNTFNY